MSTPYVSAPLRRLVVERAGNLDRKELPALFEEQRGRCIKRWVRRSRQVLTQPDPSRRIGDSRLFSSITHSV
jgi:hypothetical protein